MTGNNERLVTYKSRWTGQLCGEEVFVDLELYNFTDDEQWSWRAMMYRLGQIDCIWRIDYTNDLSFNYVLKPDRFQSREEAFEVASEWMRNLGFGYDTEVSN